jgi:myo-inositol-1(or 4)-monophosphatase
MTPSFDIEAIISVARRAGQLVFNMRREGLRNVQTKSTEIDLVTEADLASEAFLRTELNQLYPQVGFWGEESNQQPQEEFFWIVDPIDGTVNYANGVAFYAVNLGLQQGETTLLGVTVEPFSGRIYWTVRGEGAYLRDADGTRHRLRVNEVDRLNRALVTTGFPYHRNDSTDNNSAEFSYFLRRCQAVRCMGAAALDLTHVASGVMAAYWEAWLNPWDAAPGVLMAREAGGQVTDYAGQPWTLTSQSLVASNGNPALHHAMLEGIAQVRAAPAASNEGGTS